MQESYYLRFYKENRKRKDKKIDTSNLGWWISSNSSAAPKVAMKGEERRATRAQEGVNSMMLYSKEVEMLWHGF